jgi:hypothetical protein
VLVALLGWLVDVLWLSAITLVAVYAFVRLSKQRAVRRIRTRLHRCQQDEPFQERLK